MATTNLTRREALRASMGLAGAAGLASACATTQGEAVSPVDFRHGVASGDPLGDRVVIWTRATPREADATSARVRWVVARDPGLRDIVREGFGRTGPDADFTIKADVDGLAPGQSYYYGFFGADADSPVGLTRTLPESGVERMVIAACSCSNHPFGYFHAYRHIAARSDIDLVLHLGDYIYEYGGADSWGQETGERLGRAHEPAHEIVSLADYRTRYAQYRSDADLQAAHAAAPWMAAWDDHEIANNPWTDGAQNHNPENGEGAWEDRKANALRAYYEWMPVREPAPGRAREAIWRSVDFGAMARIVLFETRLTGRVEQLVYERDLAGVSEEEVAAFRARLEAPDRFMIAADQERFVTDATRSRADGGAAWTVFGNQIIFARQTNPDMRLRYDQAALAALQERSPWVGGAIERSGLGLPTNLDAWDGYPVQRDRLSAAFHDSGADIVMLTGDTHCFWANELCDPRGRRFGAEFGTTGIASPGFGALYRGLEPDIQQLIVAANREIRYCNANVQGYLTLTLTHGEAVCEMFAVSDVTDPEARTAPIKSWRLRPRAPGAEAAALEEVVAA